MPLQNIYTAVCGALSRHRYHMPALVTTTTTIFSFSIFLILLWASGWAKWTTIGMGGAGGTLSAFHCNMMLTDDSRTANLCISFVFDAAYVRTYVHDYRLAGSTHPVVWVSLRNVWSGGADRRMCLGKWVSARIINLSCIWCLSICVTR